MSENENSEGLAPAFGDMPKDEFRRFGHELIDWISDYFEKIEELPVLSQIEPGDLKAQLPASPFNIGARHFWRALDCGI